jgi:hypothetical protein
MVLLLYTYIMSKNKYYEIQNKFHGWKCVLMSLSCFEVIGSVPVSNNLLISRLTMSKYLYENTSCKEWVIYSHAL